jgi:hypothetical protein
MITSQDSLAVHRSLEAAGMQIGRHLILRHRDKPYVNADLFQDCSRTVFIPRVEATRVLHGLSEEDAALLMDNCSPHLTPVVIERLSLSKAGVRIVTFALHTKHIFQVLDLVLFGVLKKHGLYQLPLRDDVPAAKCIKKVYHDFRATMIDDKIWGAFRGIDITYTTVAEVQRVLFDEKKLRESKGFRELWDIAFPLENLSARRRASKFGWINRSEYPRGL